MGVLKIYEPAMCCPTGICGPSVDSELLRISTVLEKIKKKGIIVHRYNLTNNPEVFIEHEVINRIINTDGVEALPVVIYDGTIVKKKEYPSNEALAALVNVPLKYLEKKDEVKLKGIQLK